MSATAEKTLPMKQAAKKILEDAEGPMTANDITQKAIDDGLIKSTGKTPAATMQAQLSVDIKKDDTAFLRVRPGTYGLKGRDRKGQKAKELQTA